MRVFFDTNVLISSLLSNGLCHDLLEYSVVSHEIVLSEFVLAELHENVSQIVHVATNI